jgi:hypothetical protein
MSLSTGCELEIGSIVTIKNPYHVRGASRGVVEEITAGQGWYRVWWESDGENQIHPAARTYEGYELKLIEENL